jgi:hypothetical protein
MADAPRDTGFYDTAYGHFSDELYAAIRQAAFGEDIGQNSWLTADELRTFCEWLGVDTSTELLEVASGSGGPALFTVETTGCRLFGVSTYTTRASRPPTGLPRSADSPTEPALCASTPVKRCPSTPARSTR